MCSRIVGGLSAAAVPRRPAGRWTADCRCREEAASRCLARSSQTCRRIKRQCAPRLTVGSRRLGTSRRRTTMSRLVNPRRRRHPASRGSGTAADGRPRRTLTPRPSRRRRSARSRSCRAGGVPHVTACCSSSSRVPTIRSWDDSSTAPSGSTTRIRPTSRANASRSAGYHIAMAVALALAPLAGAASGEHAFITQFLAHWGGSGAKKRVRGRRARHA